MYKISADPDKPKGIPFVAKEVNETQYTSYLVYWYEVSWFQVIPGERETSSKQTTKDQQTQTTDPEPKKITLIRERKIHKKCEKDLDDLRQLVVTANAGTLTESFGKIKNKIEGLDGFELDPEEYVQPIENYTKREVQFSNTQYYLNPKLPWFGTNNFSVDLASDGTLSKTTADASTGLTEAISTLSPLKEVLSSKLLSDDSIKIAALKIDTAKDTYRYELEIERKGLIYTFEGSPGNGPIPFDLNCLFKTRPLDTSSSNDGKSKDGEKGKPEENSLKISGEVVLPEKKKED